MRSAWHFATFFRSSGPAFPLKALLSSMKFFLFFGLPLQMQRKSSRNRLALQRKTFVPSTSKSKKVNAIPLDGTRNGSRKKRTPKSLGSTVWTPSRILVPPSLVLPSRLQPLFRINLARLRQDSKRLITRSLINFPFTKYPILIFNSLDF